MSTITMKTALLLLLLLPGLSHAYEDSSPTLQAQIDSACAVQSEYNLQPGRYYLYSPLVITTNCRIIGTGANFGTVLQPMGSSQAFIIDGDNVAGGWAFRNVLQGFTINGSTSDAPELVKINKAYTTRLIDIFIYNQATINGIDVAESNDIQLNQIVLYGGMSAGQSGIIIRDKASVIINDVDIEMYSRCLKTQGNSTTDLNSPYMERCVVNIEHNATGIGSMNVFGGKLIASNGYNVAVKANNLNIFGTKLESYNGAILNGKVAHCFTAAQTNVGLYAVTPYAGYLTNSNCDINKVIK